MWERVAPIYMASPTASICETYRHSEQKPARKFCGSKKGKNSETHPEKPEKGETGCVLGAGGGSSGWGGMKPGEKGRYRAGKGRRSPPKHGGNGGTDLNLLRKPSCGARLCLRRQGRLANRRPLRHPRLAASATGGASAAMPGTRFWSGCGRAQPGAEKGSVSPGSRRKPQKGRCWFGAASSFWRRIVYRLPLLPSKEKHLRQEDGQADQDHGRVGPGGI